MRNLVVQLAQRCLGRINQIRFGSLALILAVALSLLVSAQSSASEIKVATYHTHPPFLLDSQTGLSVELVKFLNLKLNPEYRFRLVPMTRARINRDLLRDDEFIVPWVNPLWFDDAKEVKYQWSKTELMEDGNVMLSAASMPVEFFGVESIKGLIFGGVHDHHYSGVDDYIAKEPSSYRVDNRDHQDNIRKLDKGRIDVTIMPKSAANHYLASESLQEKIYISKKHHSTYQRRVLFHIGNDTGLAAELDSILAQFAKSLER